MPAPASTSAMPGWPAVQVGKVAKRGDMAFYYIYATKGENSMISQVTDDDLGTGTGVNLRTNHFGLDYGLAKRCSSRVCYSLRSSDATAPWTLRAARRLCSPTVSLPRAVGVFVLK